MPKGKKPHWTQTPEGRERMQEIATATHRKRRQAKVGGQVQALDLLVDGKSLAAEVTSPTPTRRRRRAADKAMFNVRLLTSPSGGPQGTQYATTLNRLSWPDLMGELDSRDPARIIRIEIAPVR